MSLLRTDSRNQSWEKPQSRILVPSSSPFIDSYKIETCSPMFCFHRNVPKDMANLNYKSTNINYNRVIDVNCIIVIMTY